jgi:hypothetical protein
MRQFHAIKWVRIPSGPNGSIDMVKAVQRWYAGWNIFLNQKITYMGFGKAVSTKKSYRNAKDPFERFESENDTMQDALENAETLLEEKGLHGTPDEPAVTIIMRNTLEDGDGPRGIKTVIYIGGTTEEITNDLKTIK